MRNPCAARGLFRAHLALGLVLLAIPSAPAQERGIGQPWPDYRNPYGRTGDVGQPDEAWSNFPQGIGRWGADLAGGPRLASGTRASSLGDRRGASPGCCTQPPAIERSSVYQDRATPSLVPALQRKLDSDWRSTNRSPYFDVGYTAYTAYGVPWSGGYWGWGGWGGYGWGGGGYGWGGAWGPASFASPTGYYPLYRPWYSYPYVHRPWWRGYSPYYGGGYFGFYRPWYLDPPGIGAGIIGYPSWLGWSGTYYPPAVPAGLGCGPALGGGYAGCYYW